MIFRSFDAITEVVNPTDDPNERGNNEIVISSISDTDSLVNRFNHDNNYCDNGTKLKIGDIIRINDAASSISYMVAGFDLEYYRTASDGVVYNNGYGIALVPENAIKLERWNTTDTTVGGYVSSYVHNTVLPDICSNLKQVLGTHLVERSALLSNSIDSTGKANGWTWVTGINATLMSVGQLINGAFTTHNTIYDDGEANYRLPVFRYRSPFCAIPFWTRNIYSDTELFVMAPGVSLVNYNPSANGYNNIRPLIYLR